MQAVGDAQPGTTTPEETAPLGSKPELNQRTTAEGDAAPEEQEIKAPPRRESPTPCRPATWTLGTHYAAAAIVVEKLRGF